MFSGFASLLFSLGGFQLSFDFDLVVLKIQISISFCFSLVFVHYFLVQAAIPISFCCVYFPFLVVYNLLCVIISYISILAFLFYAEFFGFKNERKGCVSN